MKKSILKICCTLAMLQMLLFAGSPALAADDEALANVKVKYASGDTELKKLQEGVSIWTNFHRPIQKLPAELVGLTIARGSAGRDCDVTINIPPNCTVYLLVDKDDQRAKMNVALAPEGWTRLKESVMVKSQNHPKWTVYKQSFTKAITLTIPGGVPDSGLCVAAKNIEIANADPKPKDSDKASSLPKFREDVSVDTTPMVGASTRPSLQQTSIKALEVYTQDSGMMLGQTSEVVLTLTQSTSPKLVTVRFVTPVGNEMRIARDEALRFIHLSYPNWDVDRAEMTFEDKYVARDGGSIGTAIGTMILSVIQGFKIDPNVAITGDISANGKVRAIGGVSAKLRGAIASNCTLVAIPSENDGQVVDAVTYYGPVMVLDIQVISISTLDNAVATVRLDRAAQFQEAITLYATIQKSVKEKPALLKAKETQERLLKVLELAPQHLSARLLLSVVQGKHPKTLSATASTYYAFVAARPMLEVLKERGEANQKRHVQSVAIQAGLADLKKLRALSDANVRPLIDAWMRFIDAWSSMQQGSGSSQNVERQRQSLLDEMAKQQANVEVMQKMLKEGI